jgi:soluble lytic murein transglycosylase-like protein
MVRRSYVFGLALLALVARPCFADIYGFVDENGTAHFSDVQLDSRYKLYMKTPKPAQSVPAANASSETTAPPDVQTVAPRAAPRQYADMVAQVAREQKVDPALLHAVITVESAYNPRAKSPKGATGLMQLMPDTARRYGVTDLFNPLENLRGGARYLRDLLAMFDNNLRLVLAAYNAGEGAVMKFGNAIPPYAETRAYVPRVLQHYNNYRTQSRTL